MADITTIQIDKETLKRLKDLNINLEWVKLLTLNQKVTYLIGYYEKNKTL